MQTLLQRSRTVNNFTVSVVHSLLQSRFLRRNQLVVAKDVVDSHVLLLQKHVLIVPIERFLNSRKK